MSQQNEAYHVPVLAAEVVRYLVTNTTGAYLDLTIGGGGHAKVMASALEPDARVYGVDRDPVSVAFAQGVLADCRQTCTVVQGVFSEITATVGALFADKLFDGILLDLGVSSRQIDDAARGFAFQQDGPLDMRMDSASGRSAADIINSADEARLIEILRDFGEERQAARLARAIVRERQKEMIRTTGRLADIISQVIAGPYRTKSLARVFQAFRIVVNHELDELRSVLPAALSLLNPLGRMAVISYHSLEDREVKWFFRTQARPELPPNVDPTLPAPEPTLRILTPRPVEASAEEVAANSRARSAKLRVAEKV